MYTVEMGVINSMSDEERDCYFSLKKTDKKKAEDFFFQMYEKRMWYPIESTWQSREDFWKSIRKAENEYAKSRMNAEDNS